MNRTRRITVATLAALLLAPSLGACFRASPSTCDAFTMAVAGKPGGSKGGSKGGTKTKPKPGTKPKSVTKPKSGGGGGSDHSDDCD